MSTTKKNHSNTDTWKPVGVEPYSELYQINRSGEVRGVKNKNILAPGRPASPFVVLTMNGVRKAFSISTLMKATFNDVLPLSKANRDKAVLKALVTKSVKAVAAEFELSETTVRKIANTK